MSSPSDVGGSDDHVPHPDEIVGLLASDLRLELVAELVRSPADLPMLRDRLRAPIRDIVTGLGRLTDTGVVVEQSGTYSVDRTIFGRSVRAAAALRPKGVTTDEQDALRRYFQRGRLVAIPGVDESAFRPVLSVLAESFPPGERFPESEVNRRLLAWNPDYASMRRHLVDYRYLGREHGEYWRLD